MVEKRNIAIEKEMIISKHINSALFIGLTICFLSCKKENCPWPNTTVNGTIIEDSTLQPINDAEVTLARQEDYDCSLFGGCLHRHIDIKTTHTNQDGVFNFKFCRDSERYYYLHLKKEGYNSYLGYHIVKLDTFLINQTKTIKLKRN